MRPTRGTFATVRTMAARPGWVLSRERLLDVLGMSMGCDDRSVDSRVKLVRRELAEIGLRHAIETVPGVGYAWAETVPAEIIEADPDAFVFRSE